MNCVTWAIEKLDYAAYMLDINLGKVRRGSFEAQLDLTNKCNLRCIYCPLYSEFVKGNFNHKKASTRDLDIALAKSIISQLKMSGTKQILITGEGEPFLYKKMRELIKQIKQENLECGIVTNGTLLTSDISKFLIKNKVEKIIVSVNAGDSKKYKQATGADYFGVVTENLKQLNALKKRGKNEKPKVFISFIPIKLNVQSLFDIILLSKEVDASLILKKFISFKGTERFQIRYDKKFKNTLIKFEKQCRNLKVKNNIPAYIDEVYSAKIPFCYAGWLITRIKINGDVVVCCSNNNYVIGNLKKNSFKEIWYSEGYEQFRKLHRDYDKRVKCGFTCKKCQLHQINKKVESFDFKKIFFK